MRKIHCSPLAFQQERHGHASETARSVSGAAGISAQLLQQAGEPGVGARIDLRLQAVKDMGAPFGKVGDARRRAFGMEAEAQHVEDGRASCQDRVCAYGWVSVVAGPL